jgi:two-component system nitrate/nitrite response regulator NarL
MNAIKVIIAGGNPVISAGVEALLRQECDVNVLDRVEDRPGILKSLVLKPDVLVMASSFCVPEESKKTIRMVKDSFPCVKILFFLDRDTTDENLLQYLALGIRGYIKPRAKNSHMADALRAVCAGGLWAERKLLDKYVSYYSLASANVNSTGPDGNALTKREKEIISLLTLGLTNKALSKRLHISEKTVKTHLHHLFRKHQVRNRTELVISHLRSVSVAAR